MSFLLKILIFNHENRYTSETKFRVSQKRGSQVNLRDYQRFCTEMSILMKITIFRFKNRIFNEEFLENHGRMFSSTFMRFSTILHSNVDFDKNCNF